MAEEKEVLEFESTGLDEQISKLEQRNQALDDNAQSSDRLVGSTESLSDAFKNEADALDQIANALRESDSAAGELFRSTEEQAQVVGELVGKLQEQQAQQDELSNTVRETAAAYGDLAPETQAAYEALRNVTQEVGQTQAELDAATNTLGDMADELANAVASDDELAASLGDLNGALGDTGASADEAAGGVSGLGEESSGASEQTSQLSGSLDDMLDAMSSLPGPIGQVSSGLAGMVSKAGETGAAFGGISAGLAGFAVAAAAVVGVTAGLSAAIQATEDYAVSIAKASVITGETVEYLSGLAEAADDASIALTGEGKSIDQVASALQRFNILLGRGVDENGQYTEGSKRINTALKELGVEAADTHGRLRPLKELLPDIADGFKKIGAGAQSTSLAKQLGLQDVLPLLLQGRDAFSGLNAVISKDGVDAVIKYKSSADQLEDTLRNIKIVAGELAAPIANFGLELANLETGNFLTGLVKTRDAIVGIREAFNNLVFGDAPIAVIEETSYAYLKQGEAMQKVVDAQKAVDRANDEAAQHFNPFQQYLNTLGERKADLDVYIAAQQKLAEQEQKAIAQAVALAKSKLASDELAAAQGRLASRLDEVNGSIGKQSKPLDEQARAQAALAIATGETTAQQVVEGEAVKALNAAREKGIITYEQQIGLLKNFRDGTADVNDLFQASGKAADPYIKSLRDLGLTYKDALDFADKFKSKEEENADAFDKGTEKYAKGALKRQEALKGALGNLGVDGTQTRLEFVFDVKNQAELDAALERLKDAPVEQRVKFAIDFLGGPEKVGEIAEILKGLPDEKTVKASFEATKTDTVDELISFLKGTGGGETARDVRMNVVGNLGASSTAEAIAKLEALQNKDIQYAIKLTGAEDAKQAADLLTGKLITLEGKTYTFDVKTDTTPAQNNIQAVKDKAENLKDKSITIEAVNQPALSAISGVQTARDRLSDKSIAINVTGGALSEINSISSAINRLPTNKQITITTVNRTVGAPSTAQCFVAGTPVAVAPSGSIPIEQLSVGALVFSLHHSSARVVPARVVALLKSQAPETVIVTVAYNNGDGEAVTDAIQCTPNHPFCTDAQTGEYTAAKDLAANQRVISLASIESYVVSVTQATEAWVYNIEVEGTHNYFAGVSQTLVHNDSEQLDVKLSEVLASMARLRVAGAPGAFDRGEQLVDRVLSPVRQSIAGGAPIGGIQQNFNQTNIVQSPTDFEAVMRRQALLARMSRQ